MANISRALSGEFTASRYPHLLYILVGAVPVTRNRGHLEKLRQLRSAVLRNRSSGSSCIKPTATSTLPGPYPVWWKCFGGNAYGGRYDDGGSEGAESRGELWRTTITGGAAAACLDMRTHGRPSTHFDRRQGQTARRVSHTPDPHSKT